MIGAKSCNYAWTLRKRNPAQLQQARGPKEQKNMTQNTLKTRFFTKSVIVEKKNINDTIQSTRVEKSKDFQKIAV